MSFEIGDLLVCTKPFHVQSQTSYFTIWPNEILFLIGIEETSYTDGSSKAELYLWGMSNCQKLYVTFHSNIAKYLKKVND